MIIIKREKNIVINNITILTYPGYPLRPEIVESAYYLYRYTKDRDYRLMAEQIFRDFVKHCRTDAGYAALKDVTSKEKSDSMQSFLFAETFKYFYLLFAPRRTLDFDKVIFNTEAHPIRRTWPAPKARNVRAQGNALGYRGIRVLEALKARNG